MITHVRYLLFLLNISSFLLLSLSRLSPPPTLQGSLDDILSSDAINLDWNFKYALLKVQIQTLLFSHQK